MSGERQLNRVLIADDDAMLREIAVAMLENAGFKVRTACSGDAALAACAAEMPDIALLDVEMPDGDGHQACANIRALPGGADVPIIMVTGLDDASSIDRAYQAGATDYVVKPINWPLLTHRIEHVLRGSRKLDALRASEQTSATLLKLLPDGIFLIDAHGVIGDRFSAVKGLINTGSQPRSGPLRLLDLLPATIHATAKERLQRALHGAAAAFEFSVEPQAGVTRYFECRLQPKTSGQVLAIMRDVTQRKDSEGRMRRLAYSDALTGLPNRAWLRTYLTKALARAEREQRTVALLFVDLDGFKRINDTLGHETGDALLAQVAGRLRSAMGCYRGGLDSEAPAASATRADSPAVTAQLARLGGDEFVAVLTGWVSSQDAEEAAQRIRAELTVPFALAGYELSVTPSIGIALSPQHGRDAKSLLKSADAAMYQAKANGRNQYRLYDDTLRARAQSRQSLEADLRRAFEQRSLEVYYQPKYDTHSLQIMGAEALLRWVHGARGEIPGAELAAVAEEIGLIGELERFTLEQVCRDVRAWRSQDISLGNIALKISGREFLRQEMPLRMSGIITKAGVEPSLFELELSEAVLMQDSQAGQRSLMALKELGFTLAVDDFGSGHCSLNSLKRFPLDALKIAASFVDEMTNDTGDAAIVRAIIALGRKLNLRVVAKGVATVAQLQFLRAENCDLVQGPMMSPALSAERLAKLLLGSDASTQTVRALQIAVSQEADSA